MNPTTAIYTQSNLTAPFGGHQQKGECYEREAEGA